MTSADPVAILDRVKQGYVRRLVLDDLTWAIKPGVTALVGPNGAGKTTALKTLATVLPPTAGEVRVGNIRVVDEASARLARRHIGYLPQKFGYASSFTVADTVAYVAWLRAIPRARVSDAAAQALSATDLEDIATKRMSGLSGGMVQRVGLACAMVGAPPLILLDEPTVGLDPEQRVHFRNAIRRLENSAVVLSTHLIDDAAVIADRFVVMVEGTLVFEGPPAALAALDAGGPGDSALERAYLALTRRQDLVVDGAS